MYDGVLGFLQGSEERLVRWLATDASPDVARGLKLPVTHGDVAFLVEEVGRGRSAVSGVPTKLVLVRWRRPTSEADAMITLGDDGNNDREKQKSSTLRLRDLVCMTKEEATRHERLVFGEGRPVEDVYDADVIRRVEERMAVAERYERYR